MTSKTRAGWVAVVAAAVMVSCAFAQPPAPPAAESGQQINDFSLAGYGDRGKKTWDLAGTSADIYDDVVKLKEIKGNMFGATENVTLTADKGDFNKSDGKVHLQDHVVITTTSGAVMKTDSLDWDRKNDVVSTPAKVNLVKDQMTTTGTGATGHPTLNTMMLEKDVTVTMTPPKETTQITVTCDGPLEVEYQKNVATFRNNVKADKGDSVIYCDVLELYFTKKEGAEKPAAPPVTAEQGLASNKIDRIVARGNVRIVRGENVSYCQEATYTGADQKLTLTGRPKLVIYSTEDMKGALSGS